MTKQHTHSDSRYHPATCAACRAAIKAADRAFWAVETQREG